MNVNKCYGTVVVTIIFQVHGRKTILSRYTEIKVLGVWLESKLPFNKHIDQTVSAACKIFGFRFYQRRTIETILFLISLIQTWTCTKKISSCSLKAIQKNYVKFLLFKSTWTFPKEVCTTKCCYLNLNLPLCILSTLPINWFILIYCVKLNYYLY